MSTQDPIKHLGGTVSRVNGFIVSGVPVYSMIRANNKESSMSSEYLKNLTQEQKKEMLLKAKVSRDSNKLAEQNYIKANRLILADGYVIEPDSLPGIGWKLISPSRFEGDKLTVRYYANQSKCLAEAASDVSASWLLFLKSLK